MFAGTTFAWFTDSESTAVNKIQAGNLDVDLFGIKANGANGDKIEEEDILNFLLNNGMCYKVKGIYGK